MILELVFTACFVSADGEECGDNVHASWQGPTAIELQECADRAERMRRMHAAYVNARCELRPDE